MGCKKNYYICIQKHAEFRFASLYFQDKRQRVFRGAYQGGVQEALRLEKSSFESGAKREVRNTFIN